MTIKDYQLNENARFIFTYSNHLYRVSINIYNGIITLEEVHNTTEEDKDIKSVIFIKDSNTNKENKVEGLIETKDSNSTVTNK